MTPHCQNFQELQNSQILFYQIDICSWSSYSFHLLLFNLLCRIFASFSSSIKPWHSVIRPGSFRINWLLKIWEAEEDLSIGSFSYLVAFTCMPYGWTNTILSFNKLPSSLSNLSASSICLIKESLWKHLSTLYSNSASTPLCSKTQWSHKLLFFLLPRVAFCSLYLTFADLDVSPCITCLLLSIGSSFFLGSSQHLIQ